MNCPGRPTSGRRIVPCPGKIGHEEGNPYYHCGQCKRRFSSAEIVAIRKAQAHRRRRTRDLDEPLVQGSLEMT